MKKLVLMSLFLIAFGGLASATLTSPCGLLMSANTSGNSGGTCAATPDPGDYINSLTITITDDYTGLQSGTPSVTYTGTLSQSSPVFLAPTFCVVSTGESGSNPCLATINPSGTVTGLDLSTYSIQIIDGSNSVAGGVVTGASEVLTLSYTEAPIEGGGVPEPTTLSLVGGALLGLGFLARKKKQ